jgi:hypothetical protein
MKFMGYNMVMFAFWKPIIMRYTLWCNEYTMKFRDSVKGFTGFKDCNFPIAMAHKLPEGNKILTLS